MSTRAQLAIAALLLLAALIAPLFVSNYWVRVLTQVFMFATVAQGLNVIVGFAGYHAFGNSAFFGVGAYASGVAMSLGVPVPLAIGLGLAAAAAIAGLLGWPLLRLKGHYFAIATVALNMALVELVINVGGVTGGAQGLPLPISEIAPDRLYRIIYFVMLSAALAATLTVWWLSFSRLGYALRALRDSESGAEVMGVDTVKAKILAWVISAAMTGGVGAIWAWWITFIEVGSAFDISISVRGYIMMLLGGMATIVGPVIGAILFEIAANLVWAKFSGTHNMLLGAFVVLVVLLLPNGLVDFLSGRLLRERRAGREAAA
jgi:branched-chain amino acid transport system permease protein